MIWIAAICTAFFSGFVDAVAGGGGLIQLPMLMLLFPQFSPAVLLSTNKIASFSGTCAATWSYARNLRLDWSLVVVSAGGAILFSALGAYLVSQVPSNVFGPMAAVLLLLVIIGCSRIRVDKLTQSTSANSKRQAIVIALVAGLYDGFFGPGTGTILIFLFVSRLGLSYVSASAHAKAVNLSTNFGALVYFISSGSVEPGLAISMACANVFGALLGTQAVILKGNLFVQKIVRMVSILIVARVMTALFF